MARKSRKNLENAPMQAAKKSVYNAGAYIRLSVVDRKQKGDSIETQQAIISAFIDEYPNIELREVYIDNGKTGQSFDRPAFGRMVADMESGKINCCIVKDLSRLGRNAIDAGYYIEKYFPSKGIRFIAITDDYDSLDGHGGGIMVSLKNMVNETYAIEVGRKIRATHQMNIGSGRYVGNLPPYGYLKSKDDCHQLVPDETTAPIVSHIYEMAAEGQSVKAIMRWLTDANVLTPSRYFYSIGLLVESKIGPHAHWSFGVLDTLLSNRMYCGDMVQGKSKTVNYVTKKLPKSEWTIVPNTHEPIVSRELWEQVQEIRDNSGSKKRPMFTTPTAENIFLRKVYCGHCGFSMGRRRYSEKAYGFVCSTSRLYPDGACNGAKISEVELRKTLLNMLSKQKANIGEILSSISSGEQSVSKESDELVSIRAELEKNKLYFKGLYESLISGDITTVEYHEMKVAYEAKITALTERERQLREYGKQRVHQENLLTGAQQSVRSLKRMSDLTTEVIDRLVERIDIFEDKHIEVKFTFTDEVLIGNGGEDYE